MRNLKFFSENICTVQNPLLVLHTKNVNFFIVKVLVKLDEGGCEVTLIAFYTPMLYHIHLLYLILGYKNN
jgi:hypothetical protein